jgi:cytochrome c oxidase cbb3-type subunit 4
METYNALRHFADSWMLLVLTGIFVAVVAFVFRPGSTRHYRNSARIPLEDDRKV